ncbi:MAG TPA: DNA gyrase subunit A [Flavobacteriales bacterium]|nr:DNA gyrase subunit A [Flavobacteriales bacterium]
MATEDNIITINIEEEMKTAYIDYSMSVIVSRALPEVRDGLKPVHRRVLFGMLELGIRATGSFKKSARIVGEVLGKFHPHGDTSVYDAMVRMAQPWSLRYPLVHGQGNFGSVDGDPPAAMRYTEAKLTKIAEEMLFDIDKDTVDFQLNFDDTLQEPTVLPCKFPNLLVNGGSGIAVGMATNMPPHNLTEVVTATLALIDNPEMEIPELMKMVTAPDFPTGGTIYGYEGVKEAFETGRGRVVIRSKYEIETFGQDRERIIVTEIPYQVNKADMIKKTADLINSKKLDGISAIQDESDKSGMRIVYELKRGSVANIVLNHLFKSTALQSSFSVNNIALVKGKPEMLNLKLLISNFVEHRHDVVVRRTEFELKQAEKRAHILEGLIIAVDNLDAVIKLIRASKTPDDAREGLIKKFDLSDIQARAILDLRLQKLTGLEIEKLRQEHKEIMALITRLKEILANVDIRMKIISDELIEIREKYGDERKTEIEYAAGDFKVEDMYADEDMVISISHLGYIKRTPLSEYRAQHRGGKGSKGSITRDEDFIEYLFVATMHNYLLFFTEQGKVFWLRVYEVPEGGKTSKGRAIQNMINIPPEDKVKAFVNVKDLKDEEYTNNNYVVLCTKKGVIKKTTLALYSRPRANGIIAINIREGDQLLEAKLTSGEHDIMLGVRSGKAIRFPESKVRPMGRGAAGVKGITLSDPKKDEVIGMICVLGENESILVVAENGIGKRSSIEDYRITNRGGKGVKTINITQKTGALIALKSVTDENDLMIMNKSGIMIRLKVSTLRVMGRATQGVKLINLKEGDAIAAVTKVEIGDEEDNLMEGEEGFEEGEKGEEASEDGTVVDAVEVDEADETDEEKDEETDESADEGDEEEDDK